MRWGGNIVSKLQELQGKIKYLLDADLSSDIAIALRPLEFDVIHTGEVLEFQDHLNELYDPEIIAWCKNNGRTWITHDFNARRKHLEAIKLARINVVWIRINTKQNITVPNESAT